jgi:hypothetical protein
MARQSDTKSLKTMWSDYHLVNYASYQNPIFLSNRYERVAKLVGQERERRVITLVGETQIPLGEWFKHSYADDDIQYSYNTNNTFFVHTTSGDFHSLHLSYPENGKLKISREKTYTGSKTRIVSAHTLATGVVIETDDHILHFDNNGNWSLIEDNEVMMIRTFPRSTSYQNIVAITQEEGVLLASVLDEQQFSAPSEERHTLRQDNAVHSASVFA